MKKLIVGNTEIELNIGEVLTVKEFRKIYPIIKEHWNNEIEMIIQVIKVLSDQEWVEEIMDGLSLQDFTSLSEQIAPIIKGEQEKKK